MQSYIINPVHYYIKSKVTVTQVLRYVGGRSPDLVDELIDRSLASP